MMTNYADIADIRAIGRPLTEAQSEAAEILLATASSKLRLLAAKYGKNIDSLIADETLGNDYAAAVKSVVVQAVVRALNSISDTAPSVSQSTESIGAYSLTTAYINAGQSLYFLKNELKDLGLMRQTYGAMELYQQE